ncbi:hypothetical protein QTP88_015506 [Uroleucon formosanum]
MNLNMVNFINNKLAFFFIFYFIASTLAYQDTDMSKRKLKHCQLMMCRINLMELYGNEYQNKSNWKHTLETVARPICNHVELYKQNKTKDNERNPKNILDNLFLTCNFLHVYRTTKELHKLFMDNFLPVCFTLKDYHPESVTRNSNYTELEKNFLNIEAKCKFIQTFKKKSGYLIDDFYPICNFVNNLRIGN